jgi:transcriptional regulator with XRE-family HTH domain
MPQPNLGKQLRSLREEHGYSRAEVAAEAGLSASFLALVESGKSDISITRLVKLAELYDVGLADLVPSKRRSAVDIMRKGEHRELISEDERLKIRVLTRMDRVRALEPTISTLEPGGETVKFVQRLTDSFIYVLTGDLTLTLEGHRPTIVREGDSVYIEARTRRSLRNDGTVPVSWIGIAAPAPPPGRLTTSPRQVDELSV